MMNVHKVSKRDPDIINFKNGSFLIDNDAGGVGSNYSDGTENRTELDVEVDEMEANFYEC